jgi:hypothetical protein
MQSCDSDNFKLVTDSYAKTYQYVDYNNLTDLQKELIEERSGLWFTLHNVYYNIPVCKHPVGVDSLTNFINYLILTEPERVRDFWLYATFMEVLTELTTNPRRYFAQMYINDEQGFVFTGKGADIINVPEHLAVIKIDDELQRQLSVLPNPAGNVTTWAEFQKINEPAAIIPGSVTSVAACPSIVKPKCARRRSRRRRSVVRRRSHKLHA